MLFAAIAALSFAATDASATSLLEELNETVAFLMPNASEEERTRIAFYQQRIMVCPSETNEPEGTTFGVRLRSGKDLLVKTITLDDRTFCLFLSSPEKRPLTAAEARQVEALTILPDLKVMRN
jgi:hypothetical protein